MEEKKFGKSSTYQHEYEMSSSQVSVFLLEKGTRKQIRTEVSTLSGKRTVRVYSNGTSDTLSFDHSVEELMKGAGVSEDPMKRKGACSTGQYQTAQVMYPAKLCRGVVKSIDGIKVVVFRTEIRRGSSVVETVLTSRALDDLSKIIYEERRLVSGGVITFSETTMYRHEISR